MLETLTLMMESLETFMWTYFGFGAIVLAGLWFTYRSRFAQVRLFPKAAKYALEQSGTGHNHEDGVHPMKAFWATVGGAVGIGNVVGTCSAVQIGGPGAVFWVWFVAFVGVLLKYAEVYLGILHRRRRADGGWDGGPMYYLMDAYKHRFAPIFAAILLWIYGVEVYQFHVMVETVSINWQLSPWLVMPIMLALIFFAVRGGMKSLAAVASKIVPIMILGYLIMAGYVLAIHLTDLPNVFRAIFSSAFSGHAAVGGFIGCTFMQTFSQGIARGCYASDIGIGYTSILHAETSESRPEKQASLTFLGIFVDILGMCTLSMLLILVTGTWQEPIDQTLQVQVALSRYFPYVDLLMPLLIFFLGYSTVTAYFVFGCKAARFLSPKYGEKLYYLYGLVMLSSFTFCSTRQALLVMSLSGATLLVINLGAFLLLQRQVRYEIDN